MLRIAALLALIAAPLHAEEVTLRHGELTLLGDFVQADETAAPVALITHGTLAHRDMELIEALQDVLAERGISSLAHTLSLGIDRREGMADCDAPHIHRDTDADEEIIAWIDWLADEGHTNPALIGHSRGGRQVARAAAGRDDLSAVILLAPATTRSAERGRAGYESRFGGSLDTLLATAREAGADDLLEVPGLLYCPDVRASAASVLSYYGGVPTGADTYLSDITAPVLVILAQKDDVLPEAPATYIPLRRPGLTVEVVEDADHMFLDFYTDDAGDHIEAFLAGIDAPDERDTVIDFAAADPEYGAYLAQECSSCHRASDDTQAVPALNGLEADHIYLALEDYATGLRDNAAMGLVARSLDDEQRIALSAHFSRLDD